MVRISFARMMAERISSIDSMRILAVACVVILHTDPFAGLGVYGNIVNFVLESSARFAVPFFFMTAGYFFALKTARTDPTDYFTSRVVTLVSIYGFGIALSSPVFLAETVVRAGIKNRDYMASTTHKLSEFVSPLELLYYGDSISEILWFIPSLLFSFTFIYVFIRSKKTIYLIPVSTAFHIIGLLGASYTMFVDVPFSIRDALFFGFFYTSLGYAIRSHDWQPTAERSRLYLGATILFGALHIVERYVLGYQLSEKTLSQGVYSPEYTIGTALVAITLFLFLLSRPRLGTGTRLPAWGRYAVGIYIAHPPVLVTLWLIGDALSVMGYEIQNTIVWHLTLTPVTFFGGALICIAAHKLGVTEIGGIHLPRPRWLHDRDLSWL